jgi:DNA-binding transcriptional regulator YiaG
MKKAILHYSICGLDYVYLKNVPVRQTSHGEVLDARLCRVERAIATEIVKKGIPIRGMEVKFLRKSLALSMEKFGKLLGISAPAILKWERASARRLEPINEVAVRALMAEQLSIAMEGRFTVLKGNESTPARLMLQVA